MSANKNNLNTSTVDLFSPSSRFSSASNIYARLHRWCLLLRRYWLPLALIPAAVVIPIFFHAVLTGPVYESRACMWVTGKINVSENYGYTEQLVDYLGTQSALLQSPAIQRRAFARLRGDTNTLSSVPFGVKVDQGAKSSTLDLRVTGRNAADTQQFLNCLMAEYLQFKKESSDNASAQAATSLNAEASRLKNELAAARTQLQDFEASNNVVFLQQQGSSAQNYLATLSRQLATLRTESKLLDSLKPEQWTETDNLQIGGNTDSAGDAAARQMLASLQQSQAALFQADQQMHLLIAQRDQIARFLRPAHPKIIKLNQDIAMQQEIVQASRDEAAKQLTLRREALALQITNLETASLEWNDKSVAASRKMADYDQIQQKIQRLQTAYDKTFGLIQNIDVAQRVEQADVGILDPASAAKPTRRFLFHMAFAVAVSLALCFGLLYCLAFFQDHFASRAELSEQFTEPVLGQIPFIAMENGSTPLQIEGADRQRYEFAEAFRNIRASLLFIHNGTACPQIIAIASSVPEEGKSTVAAYLAASLARAKSRVLLIDGDMRRPNLHNYFNLPVAPGLAELLDEQIPFVDALHSTGMNNLTLLPAGEAKQNPGDLVLSSAWPSLLAVAKLQFDYVIVDTPPVAATDDAASLAPKTDGVLFIVRAMSTSARVARDALAVLRLRHARVMGLIFNRAESSPCERLYYQPYANDYRWRSEQNGIAGHDENLLANSAETPNVANGSY